MSSELSTGGDTETDSTREAVHARELYVFRHSSRRGRTYGLARPARELKAFASEENGGDSALNLPGSVPIDPAGTWSGFDRGLNAAGRDLNRITRTASGADRGLNTAASVVNEIARTANGVDRGLNAAGSDLN